MSSRPRATKGSSKGGRAGRKGGREKSGDGVGEAVPEALQAVGQDQSGIFVVSGFDLIWLICNYGEVVF